jgi:cyclic pyranopterin phosphate synthase
LTGGELNPVLRGIGTARRVGLHPIRINAVVLAGINDEHLSSMVRWAGVHGLGIRFLEAMPIGAAAEFNRAHFVSAESILGRLTEAFEVSDLGRSPGSTAHQYRLKAPGIETSVGIIAPVTRPFCGDCRRMRMTADGRLFPCLQDPRCIALGPLLSAPFDGAVVCEALAAGIADKPAAGSVQRVQMVQLGG